MAAAGYHYDSLRSIALETAGLLHAEFDTFHRYYHPLKKRIVLPNDFEDDIWAGEYYPRRVGERFVSIEMRDAYIDTLTVKSETAREAFYADTLKMFVFAAMYPEKKSADSILHILKPRFKEAAIIPDEIYMGCMH